MLVDYDECGGTVTNFRCVLGDWGTANITSVSFFGGTPVYAGPRSFEDRLKDLFSFGRLALELFLEQQGKSQRYNRRSIRDLIQTN